MRKIKKIVVITGSGSGDESGTLTAEDIMKYLGESVTTIEDERIQFNPTFYIDNGNLEVLGRISFGAFGNVYKCHEKTSQAERAVKIIKTVVMNNSSKAEEIDREIGTLVKIWNSNPANCVQKCIVQFFRAFTDCNHRCFVYELLGPTLEHVLTRMSATRCFSWCEVRKISYQICIAVNYLHSIGLIHHDVKPDNVAFAHPEYKAFKGMEVNVKLIDFGSTVSSFNMKSVTATTLHYACLDMTLNGRSSYTSDVWSLGCTMYEIYGIEHLFPCENVVEKFYMAEKILDEKIQPAIVDSTKFNCFDEQGCLKYDTQFASVIDKVKPFDKYNTTPQSRTAVKFFDLLKKMLVISCSNRIDSCQVLLHPFFASHPELGDYTPVVPPTTKNLGIYQVDRVSFKIKSNIDLINLVD